MNEENAIKICSRRIDDLQNIVRELQREVADLKEELRIEREVMESEN